MRRQRAKRQLVKRCVVYCEGQTERNYVIGLRDWIRSADPSVEISISPVDVKGGGYADMLKALKQAPDSNCVARVVLLDFDRYVYHPNERSVFKELLEVSKATARKRVPIIVVASNHSFEDVICFHDPKYCGGGSESFLQREWGYRNLEDCKADSGIWDACHRDSRSLEVALRALEVRAPLIQNKISVKPGKASPVELSKVEFDESRESCVCSNFGDLVYIARLGRV